MITAARLQTLWRSLIGQDEGESHPVDTPLAGLDPVVIDDFEIAPNDPVIAYFQGVGRAVEIESLNLDSPAVRMLKSAEVKISVPLVSQGELIGLINLGSRLSGRDYSTDDRRFLEDLAAQAAPAVRVAQLVRQQQEETQERERIDQELRVASIIQQTLLPEDVPHVDGWQMSAFYRPAREVGGDFYDFVDLPDGRLGIVIGDVTDKGVPASLVMATTRAVLRAAAERLISPGEVLERTNDMIQPDIPPRMFVTCLYAVLDPANGRLQYANAGHDLPYCRTGDDIVELRATGMPLGLMPGMTYEQKEMALRPGDRILFYSDGLVEAHDSDREMFGFPRLRRLMTEHSDGATLISFLLGKLEEFTGPGWEQEDDVTFVTLERMETSVTQNRSPNQPEESSGEPTWRTLDEFTVASGPGNERQAMEQTAEAVLELDLPEPRLERLKTAVAEATMNAMEHGNQYSAELPVSIKVMASESTLSVHITDHGGGESVPDASSPDLNAKLAGLETPRGWGLYLIQNLVDEMRTSGDEEHHTVELVMYLERDEDVSEEP